ncbi:MAG: hypothetical protein RSC04_03355, partial [Bacteroidales bacterium]
MLFLSLMSCPSIAQTKAFYYDTLNKHTLQYLKHFDSTLLSRYPKPHFDPDSILVWSDTSYLYASIDKQVNFAEKAIRRHWGLAASGMYTYNSSFAPSFDEEDMFYKQRVQASLSWDLMQSSLIGSKPKLAEAQIEGELQKMNIANKQIQLAYESSLNYINDKYRNILYRLLKERESLILEILSIYEAMYHNGDVKIEVLYEYNYQKQIVQNALSLMNIYKDKPQRNIGPPLDYPKVDIQKYLALLAQKDPKMGIARKEIELIDTKIAQMGYINDMSIAPFLRYQYYSYPNIQNKTNLQAGISVLFPISSHYKAEKMAVKQREEMLQYDLQSIANNTKNKALELYQDHLRLIQKLQTCLFEMLHCRVSVLYNSYVLNMNPQAINSLQALKTIDEYMVKNLAYFALRQNFEKHLMQFRLLVAGAPLEDFTEIQKFHRKLTLSDKKISIYLWSPEYKKVDPPLLANQAWQNNISNVYIGYKASTPIAYYNPLIENNARYDITSEMIVSNTELILKDSAEIENYIHRIDSIHGIVGIHLNIEPHQLPQWNERQTEYLAALVRVIDIVRAWCDQRGLTLSASFPHNYPVEFYQAIDKKLDNLTIMLFNKSVETIFEEIEKHPYFSLPSTKFELAIRPEDFLFNYQNEIDRLQANEHIQSLAIESFGTLMSVNLRQPQLSQASDGTYTLTINSFDFVTNSLTEAQIKQQIKDPSIKIKTQHTLTSQQLELSNIPSKKKAIDLFGIIVRDK